MKWEEVRKRYPNQYVKLAILDSYKEGRRKIVTDVALMHTIVDSKTATKESLQAKRDTFIILGVKILLPEIREPIRYRKFRRIRVS